mmetsp:Transcript_19599/g.53831  ORF Transcript_19599/g.53831 Transcript_19599/m.53831 type:complete len:99 (+) Transcript_19599:3626-3922(+)
MCRDACQDDGQVLETSCATLCLILWPRSTHAALFVICYACTLECKNDYEGAMCGACKERVGMCILLLLHHAEQINFLRFSLRSSVEPSNVHSKAKGCS